MAKSLEALKQKFKKLNEKESKLRNDIKNAFKELLKGKNENNQLRTKIKIDIYGGPDFNSTIDTIEIISVYYDKDYESVLFFTANDNVLPKELDYLTLEEQMRFLEDLSKSK